MNLSKSTKSIFFMLLIAAFSVYLAACNSSSTTSPTTTDNQYLTQVVTSGVGGSDTSEGDLMASESSDLDDGGAVSDNGPMDPISNLQKWGRHVTGVNVNVGITDQGDTLKTVLITRTISGNYIIIGTVNNQVDTVVKPYTEVLTRTVAFKRIARTPHPEFNWYLYQISMLNGKTTSPQVGTDNITINSIVVSVNGGTAYTFNGPDFTQNIFTTRYFGGAGIPKFDRGSQITITLTLNSNQPDTDYVAWHWCRNTFGFHRIPFTLISQVGQTKVYQKTFNMYGNHKLGVFNGFISANTRSSLFDSNPALFSSTSVGSVYRVTQ